MTTFLRCAIRLSVLALAATTGTARAATVTFDLWALPGTLTLPAPAPVVPIWGFSGSAAGPAAVPGPVLVVTEGDTVVVNLVNGLAEPAALDFPGQALIPDQAGVAPGGAKSYAFTAGAPGTYLYQAGLLPGAEHQAPMGLYGALLVRPAAAPAQAYAGADTAFDDEAVVVLSELDPALAAAPATFDLRNYAPRYWLLNGQPWPGTAPIATAAGRRVLLRYLNAGLQHHSMALLGLNQTVIAVDGNPRAFGQAVVAETIAPGQTMDAITTIPAATPPGSRFALHDGSLKLYGGTGTGAASGFGGMLTFLTAAGTGPVTPPPATTSGVALAPNPAGGATPVTVTAAVAVAGGAVAAAEFFVDAAGTAGAGTPMAAADGAFGGASEAVAGSIPAGALAGLASGSHTVYVHGQSGAGGWGAFNFAVLVLDKTGPTTRGVVLTPGTTSGSAAVAVHATGDDGASGGGLVAAAEYAVDGGPAVGLAVNLPATVASLDGSIPAAALGALAAGPHTVSIRSQDALGNWGAPASATLTVDRTGPVTSLVAASPGVSSGSVPVRISATVADGASTVAAAEGYLDAGAVPFPFVAADGAFGGASEAVSADIPASTMAQLTVGTHAVTVRGRDLAGNWGALASGSLAKSPLAVADALAITSTTSGTPQVASVAAPGLLANDQPLGAAGRAASLVTGPVRTAGTGTGAIRVSCGASTTTGVCADGSYRVTLTPTGATPAARQASKRGTYRFTYRTTMNGVPSAPATVTITVN